MTKPRIFEPRYKAEPPRFSVSIFDGKSRMQLVYDDFGGACWVPEDQAEALPPCTDPDALYEAAIQQAGV